MIQLQPFRPEDIPRLINWINSPALLVQWTGNAFEYPLTEKQYGEYFQKAHQRQNAAFIWKVVHLPGKKVIGHVELCDINLNDRSAKVARMFVVPEEQGKGYGTKILHKVLNAGFEKLGLKKILLNVVIFNLPAIACYKKVGFSIEETIKNQVRIGDKLWSAYRMSITREKWEQAVRSGY